MNNSQPLEQNKLSIDQVENFYVDIFASGQVQHFNKMVPPNTLSRTGVVVDIGGGCGYFARTLSKETGFRVRVIDQDPMSIDICKTVNGGSVEAFLGDALNPSIRGDEEIVCFNLILHHLIGKNEQETRQLQINVLNIWLRQAKFIFVNEYVYDSYILNLSGKLIYSITKSKFLSLVCSLVGKFIPSLRANTSGVGVRFRSHDEWVDIFNNCGYRIVGKTYGRKDPVSLPRRFLLIKEIRRDSFLLQPAPQQAPCVRNNL